MTANLTQAEADALLQMGKAQLDAAATYQFPAPGGKCAVPLISGRGKTREDFLLDIYQGSIGIKIKYQTRGRKVVPLARLDFGGPPHRNPDGEEIVAHHLHLYREGYGDKWAYPLSSNHFSNVDDRRMLFKDFLRYCNIVNVSIQWRLSHD